MRRSGSSKPRCRICSLAPASSGRHPSRRWSVPPSCYDYAQTKAATISRQTVGRERHPRKRRGPRPDLDAAPGQRRCHAGKAERIRRQDTDRPPRPARRTRLHLRAARRERRQLLDRTRLWQSAAAHGAVDRERAISKFGNQKIRKLREKIGRGYMPDLALPSRISQSFWLSKDQPPHQELYVSHV